MKENPFEILRLDPKASDAEILDQAARLRQRAGTEEEVNALRQAVQLLLSNPNAEARVLLAYQTPPNPAYETMNLERLAQTFRRPVRSQESGVRSQESGVRCQESGVRSQVSGVRSQESGVRCQESGVRSQESGVRSQESGVRSQESGVISNQNAGTNTCATPIPDIVREQFESALLEVVSSELAEGWSREVKLETPPVDEKPEEIDLQLSEAHRQLRLCDPGAC